MKRARQILGLGTLAIVAVGVLSACMSRPPADLGDRMWIHFQDAGEVQTALILGDLDRARSAARRLAAEGRVFGVADDAEPQLITFRAQAQAVADAETFAEAVASASGMATACGDCHTAQNTGPVFSPVGEMPEFEGSHMVEHIWAADRLWEGLVQPESDRWAAGARVLAEHEVPMDYLAPGTSGLGIQLKSLGVDAMSDEPGGQRLASYAEIMATCISCHTSAR